MSRMELICVCVCVWCTRTFEEVSLHVEDGPDLCDPVLLDVLARRLDDDAQVRAGSLVDQSERQRVILPPALVQRHLIGLSNTNTSIIIGCC